MSEGTKPLPPTLKSTNARIDKLELYINDEAIATQTYCKEYVENYNKFVAIKEYNLYSMLLCIFSCLAVIEFLQLFSAIGSMFMTTADCIFIGAKFFIYCAACWYCYGQGRLGEKNHD